MILENCPEKFPSLSDLSPFYSMDTINQPSHPQLITVFFVVKLRHTRLFLSYSARNETYLSCYVLT